MPKKKPNFDRPNFSYTIDMDDVLRLVYTQLPKMKLYCEKTRVAYLPCKMTPLYNPNPNPKKRKKTKSKFRRKARFG